MVKVCEVCGCEYSRPSGRTDKAWEKRRFCSKACVTKSRWSTTGFKRESESIGNRFWKFVNKTDIGCWEWTGAQDNHGYGQISNGKNKSPKKAHRVSWRIHFGEIPHGLDVCHACDNSLCVNPKHLMLGTRMANMVDASKKGRLSRRS